MYKVGFTAGVFDLFHIGHLNLLEKCKKECEKLIVGICNDDYVLSVKRKHPIIAEDDRIRIIKALKCVDDAVLMNIEEVSDKMKVWEKVHFDVLFSGDDWKGSERYKMTEKHFKEIGVDIVYFPYTQGVSSSQIKEKMLSTDKR